jgi:transcriptional regulator with XRE-family HTH domain
MEAKSLSSADVERLSRGRITRATVNRIKRGEVNPSLETLIGLCEGLSLAPVVVLSAALGRPLASLAEQERLLLLFEALEPDWRAFFLWQIEAAWGYTQGLQAPRLPQASELPTSNVEVLELIEKKSAK